MTKYKKLLFQTVTIILLCFSLCFCYTLAWKPVIFLFTVLVSVIFIVFNWSLFNSYRYFGQTYPIGKFTDLFSGYLSRQFFFFSVQVDILVTLFLASLQTTTFKGINLISVAIFCLPEHCFFIVLLNKFLFSFNRQ